MSDKDLNQHRFLTPDDFGQNPSAKETKMNLGSGSMPNINQSNTNYIFNGGQVSISGVNNF